MQLSPKAKEDYAMLFSSMLFCVDFGLDYFMHLYKNHVKR